MTNDQEEEKRKLNNTENPHINRGFELMLRQHNRRRKLSEPKTFQVCFDKMISLFRREIHFNLDLFLIIKKK
jgi:hypothetical protein